MNELDNIVETLIDNFKKLLFPEEWINFDLKFSKLEIFSMLLLDRNSEVTMSELIEYINSPMSTATGIVDRLVKKGFVVRDRSETDRRIVIIKLTEEGTKVIKNLKDIIGQYVNMAIECLSEEEKQIMMKIIFKVIKNLQDKLSNYSSPQNETETIKQIDIE